MQVQMLNKIKSWYNYKIKSVTIIILDFFQFPSWNREFYKVFIVCFRLRVHTWFMMNLAFLKLFFYDNLLNRITFIWSTRNISVPDSNYVQKNTFWTIFFIIMNWLWLSNLVASISDGFIAWHYPIKSNSKR